MHQPDIPLLAAVVILIVAAAAAFVADQPLRNSSRVWCYPVMVMATVAMNIGPHGGGGDQAGAVGRHDRAGLRALAGVRRAPSRPRGRHPPVTATAANADPMSST
jgi:hypothetical protein